MLEEKDQELEQPILAVEEVTTPEVVTEDDAESAEDLLLITEQVTFGEAHDDFNWPKDKRVFRTYNDIDHKRYSDAYEASLKSVAENEIIAGRVTAIAEGDVVLDINYKSDGLVPLNEFRGKEVRVGDIVEVYVEKTEDSKGQLSISYKKANLLRAWDRIVDSFTNGTIITGTVISKTKGGLIVDAGGLETFLPGSQIDIKQITDYDQYIGKTMEFKVVKINETIKNAVVSHKALIEKDLTKQREQIISGLEKNLVLEGTVKNITDFGAFLDLGGVDGLLYITDISWGRISHPREVLSMNQKINVVVLDFDENKKRISLGYKQLQPHPWEVLDKTLGEGSIVKGKIVNIEDYGAFLEITPGVEGLIHVSEVNWSTQPVNAREFFKVGQECEAKISGINRGERKMSLTIKELTKDPWSDIEERFPISSRHTGEVKNLTPYGVFVELGEGMGGMVHISDLSWTKRYAHPSEFTKIGEKIDVLVLDINKNDRKLALGHKQIEANPWDTFENVFPVGSTHEATIIRKDDRGAIMQMAHGLEAFSPVKHLKKEDGSTPEAGDKLVVKVIEFNRDDKRILVSHARVWEDAKREADQAAKAEADAERKATDKSVKNTQDKVEKSTFGDLSIFSQLKDQLNDAKES
jgi:small subunit ribosomal protein S1